MPASYRIDVRAGVVFSVFEGHVTNEELLAHQQRMSADPHFRSIMNHVIDARNGDASSSYVRMFQTLRSQSGEDIRIFSTVEDAHRWLGLD